MITQCLTLSHYPDSILTIPCPILLMQSAKLGCDKYQIYKSLVRFKLPIFHMRNLRSTNSTLLLLLFFVVVFFLQVDASSEYAALNNEPKNKPQTQILLNQTTEAFNVVRISTYYQPLRVSSSTLSTSVHVAWVFRDMLGLELISINHG